MHRVWTLRGGCSFRSLAVVSWMISLIPRLTNVLSTVTAVARAHLGARRFSDLSAGLTFAALWHTVFTVSYINHSAADASCPTSSLWRVRVYIADIRGRLADKNTQRFLLSLHDGAPDFDTIGLPRATAFPAFNIDTRNLRL